MGWLAKKKGDHWVIGPNLNYTLCDKWEMQMYDGDKWEMRMSDGSVMVLMSLGSDSSL